LPIYLQNILSLTSASSTVAASDAF